MQSNLFCPEEVLEYLKWKLALSSQFAYDCFSTFLYFSLSFLLFNPILLGWRRGSYSNGNPDQFGVKTMDTYLIVDDSSNLVDFCC